MRTALFAGLVAVALAFSADATAASFFDVQDQVSAGQWPAAFDAARTLDSLERQGDFFTAYVAAQKLAAEDRCAEAAPVFDALALARPFFAPAYEAAYLCYHAQGNKTRAVAALDGLLAILPAGPQRDLVHQMKQQHLSEDRPSFEVYGSVAPTTNVERQTTETSLQHLTIAEESRGHPGVLLSGGGTATFKLLSNEHFHLTGVFRGEVGLSPGRRDLVTRLGFETPLYVRTTDAVGLLFTPYVSVQFQNQHYARTSAGLRGIVSYRVSDATTVSLRATGEYSKFELQPYRDGWTWDASLVAAFTINPNLLLSVSTGVDWDMALDETRRNIAVNAGLRVDYAAGADWLLAAQGNVGVRYHESPPPLSTGPNQSDWFWSARAEVANRSFTIGPFMPTLYYQYNQQFSDNVFYRYDSHDIGVTLRAKL